LILEINDSKTVIYVRKLNPKEKNGIKAPLRESDFSKKE
jgi:hypothetical protein